MNRPGRLRLAYVVNTLNPGGTERLVVDMSRAFKEDFDVEVICLDEPGEWAVGLREQGIAVHCLWRQPGLDLSIPARMARHFRRSGADIIHAHQCTPWFYAALSRLLYARPRLLLEEHGRFYPEVDKPVRRWVNRLLIRRLTHRFVAVSDDIRSRLVRYEGLDHSQIQVVYNGVKPIEPLTAAGRSKCRADLGFSDEDFVVGTVGRFDPIKNLPMLVSAFAQAGLGNDRFKCLLVGDGPERAKIEAQVAAAGLGRQVVFTGHRDDARTLVQCLDLFALSSFSEGTSMALLEAMAVAVPVVVTSVGGNPEIVLRDATGWVIESDDQAALTSAIRQAQTDPALRRERALAGQRRFTESFSFDSMIDRYRSLYSALLPNGRLAVTREIA